MINIFQPSLGIEELKAIETLFKSNWIGKGKVTDKFETLIAEKIDVYPEDICTVNSCTEGLFNIIDLLNLKKGDEVILPTISFVGAGNAIAYTNAKPVFCDVDKRTLNATADTIQEKITKRTKAIIILHYAGLPCEMDEISEICRNHNIQIIEDNACSPFSKYKGKNCGTIGDFGVWSFDAMKILVMGDGGLLYCADKAMTAKARAILYLGLTSSSGYSRDVGEEWWEFDVTLPGRRSIINDIAATIGIQQLYKVDGFIERRRQIHNIYSEELSSLDWLRIPPAFPDHVESSYYMYWIQLENSSRRNLLAQFLKKNEIYTTFRYYPLHKIKYYGHKGLLHNAEDAVERTLCLPLHQSLSEDDLARIITQVKQWSQK